MTREELIDAMPIIKAFINGDTVQYKGLDHEWKDLGVNDLDLDDFDESAWRTKPEPKYRPFKDAKECWAEMLKHQPFGWVVDTMDGVMYLIRCLEYVSVYTSIQYSFKDAFDKFAFADLVPFGVKVEE